MSRRHVPAVLGLVAGALVAVPAPAAHAATVQVRCSVPDLVAAVDAANSSPGPDTLQLARKCTYTLTAPDPVNPGNGLPVITSEITIDGRGATIRRDERGNKVPKFRILFVGPTGNLTLTRTTISGGFATDCPAFPDPPGLACGGGISNTGTMKVTRSKFIGNTARSDVFAQGGGIDSPGSGSVSETEVTANHVVYSGSEAGGGAAGGAISNDGPLTVTRSRLTGNTATVTKDTQSTAFAAGIISFAETTVEDTVISRNRAFAPGGIARGAVSNGIPVPGRLTVTGGAISDNTSDAPHGVAQGGGIANNGLMTASRVRISGNRAVAKDGTARGGGVRVGPFGTLELTDSHVTGNTADAPNGTAQGGGLDNPDGGTLTASRNKVLRNAVTAKDGTAQGGGLYHAGGTTGLGTTTLRENTITHNRAGDGGGIFKASGVLTLNGDVIRDNQPNNCSPAGTVPGCTG
ncbi:hypothetical protein ABZY83_36595 [Streptomyces virginiae]|uniref:hypothetical protein n=1 Tax=Streptomyces TaxID=1883 RepID=UPI0006AFA5F2|nr:MULTISPECIES: hypothetical protein [unclassified Streptomyces]KOU84343.1 hypothetical protein ADK93_25435 [Streptomyces sp. XY58]KOV09765.1 hypothetical protein ADK89_06685 [Streptomyces sp. XY37]KOV46652.1 hypothetical protein ADK99_21460 [Streptomyces sp. MMG1064]